MSMGDYWVGEIDTGASEKVRMLNGTRLVTVPIAGLGAGGAGSVWSWRLV